MEVGRWTVELLEVVELNAQRKAQACVICDVRRRGMEMGSVTQAFRFRANIRVHFKTT